MSTDLDNVRVEVAFSSDPNTTTPTFRDLTSRARLDRGIDITRGRSEASGQVQPGSCSLVFDNTDGALTPGNAGSPYYPNVKPQNRLRVTYRDPAVVGNLLTANAASLETSDADWFSNTAFGSLTTATVARSTTRAWTGAASLLITWPATASGSMGMTFARGLVAGRTYTASAYVWVPSGHPDVAMHVLFTASGSTVSTKGAWARVSVTFVATSQAHTIGVRTSSATAGQQCWIDGIMVDEGATAATFTTSSSPIIYRFDGYVDEWPIEWPNGGETESLSVMRAYDMQARLARGRALGSVIEETYRADDPGWYFPLSEPGESTNAGDRIAASTVAVTDKGDAGELRFASGTGPPTDAGSSPTFSPLDRFNGKYLYGRVPLVSPLGRNRTLEAVALTALDREQCIADWVDEWGSGLRVGVSETGKAQARWFNPWDTAAERTIESSSDFADGRTHNIAATLSNNGSGTSTLRLYVDGVEAATAATFSTPASGYLLPRLEWVRIGGTSYGDMFDGVISHVAGFGSALTTQLVDHRTAATTGFAGERSDERISRIATWAGIPAGLLDLDEGRALIGHTDPAGTSPLAYMQDVAETEAGILFVSTHGLLTFYNRGRTYAADTPADVSVPAESIGPDARMAASIGDVINDVTVSRSGGATVRVRDTESIAEFGVSSESFTTLSDDEEDSRSRAEWTVATHRTPTVKLPRVTLDALSEPVAAEDVRGLGIWSRVQITDMPAQAPRATEDLRVQGYTERIGRGGWALTANTSPYLVVQPMIADDPVRGLADSGNVAVY